jgi:hypothetical protein
MLLADPALEILMHSARSKTPAHRCRGLEACTTLICNAHDQKCRYGLEVRLALNSPSSNVVLQVSLFTAAVTAADG